MATPLRIFVTSRGADSSPQFGFSDTCTGEGKITAAMTVLAADVSLRWSDPIFAEKLTDTNGAAKLAQALS